MCGAKLEHWRGTANIASCYPALPQPTPTRRPEGLHSNARASRPIERGTMHVWCCVVASAFFIAKQQNTMPPRLSCSPAPMCDVSLAFRFFRAPACRWQTEARPQSLRICETADALRPAFPSSERNVYTRTLLRNARCRQGTYKSLSAASASAVARWLGEMIICCPLGWSSPLRTTEVPLQAPHNRPIPEPIHSGMLLRGSMDALIRRGAQASGQKRP